MSQPHQVYKDTKLSDSFNICYCTVYTVQNTWDKVGIVFQWENEFMHFFLVLCPVFF